MRAKMVELDWVEAVIGLGPNLFYNSPMESCVVVCNRRKPAARKGKVLFIDALSEVTRNGRRAFSRPNNKSAFCKYSVRLPPRQVLAVATLAQIAANGANLSIPQYVKRVTATATVDGTPARHPDAAWAQWQTDGRAFWQQMDALVETLDGLVVEDVERG